MRVLFLDDCNGFEHKDPIADLVDIPTNTGEKILRSLERTQPGAGRIGGKWREIMLEGNIEHTVVGSGRKSDFTEDDYDLEYKLISGNY